MRQTWCQHGQTGFCSACIMTWAPPVGTRAMMSTADDTARVVTSTSAANETVSVNVSPSVLADVMTCETQAWVRHVRGYTSREASLKAVAGQAFHAAIAAVFDPAGRDEDPIAVFHRVYDPAWERCSAEALPDQAYTPANLQRLLARWIETHPPAALPWRRVLAVEEAFRSRWWTVTAAHPRTGKHESVTVNLICRPDLIVEDAFGLIRWVDTKTTGWRITDAGWQRQLRLSLQAALYTDAVMQRYGEDRVACGGWISAIEMRTAPSSPERKCSVHRGLTYAECGSEHAKAEIIECLLLPARVEQAVEDAYRATRRLVTLRRTDGPVEGLDLSLNLHGGANGACRFCFAAEWCGAGRVAGALPSFLQYDPWVVEEGKR